MTRITELMQRTFISGPNMYFNAEYRCQLFVQKPDMIIFAFGATEGV